MAWFTKDSALPSSPRSVNMAQSTSDGPLVSAYETRIGTVTNSNEVIGYLTFLTGLLCGLFGLVVYFLTDAATTARSVGYALVALAPAAMTAGAILRTPLRKSATYLVGIGAVITLASGAWFLMIFPSGWSTTSGNPGVITAYFVGVGLMGIAGAVVPLVTDPRKVEAAEREAEAAQKREAAATREADAAERQTDAAEAREVAAKRQADAAERAEEHSADDRDARNVMAAKLESIRNSESQFETFEDSAGEYRWRLRHHDGTVLANSGGGYNSREGAQHGLTGVKRDAMGAPVLDLEPTNADVEASDHATHGENAPPVLHESVSQAVFEQYEDAAGEYRWRLRHETDGIIADGSEGYASKNGLEAAVERVREYVKPADYLEVDPVAFELYRDEGSDWRWRLIHQNGQNLADGGEGYSSRSTAVESIESVKENAPKESAAAFEIYEDKRGKYRWRLCHENDMNLTDGGQSYSSEDEAENAVERIRKYVPEAPYLDVGMAAFEVYEDKAEEWRWRLRAHNGNTLSDGGEGYASRTETQSAILAVKRHAPNAGAEWEK